MKEVVKFTNEEELKSTLESKEIDLEAEVRKMMAEELRKSYEEVFFQTLDKMSGTNSFTSLPDESKERIFKEAEPLLRVRIVQN